MYAFYARVNYPPPFHLNSELENYKPLICKPECKMRNLEPSPVPGNIGAESSFIVCLDLLPELWEKLTRSNLSESILSTFSIPQTI